jgi:hypothetical protein
VGRLEEQERDSARDGRAMIHVGLEERSECWTLEQVASCKLSTPIPLRGRVVFLVTGLPGTNNFFLQSALSLHSVRHTRTGGITLFFGGLGGVFRHWVQYHSTVDDRITGLRCNRFIIYRTA